MSDKPVEFSVELINEVTERASAILAELNTYTEDANKALEVLLTTVYLLYNGSGSDTWRVMCEGVLVSTAAHMRKQRMGDA